MKKEKTGFIYIWYDCKRKMYYIGCHLGTEDDGYICSSKWMRDAYRYRPHDFKRRILKRNIPRDQLLAEEHAWLSLIKNEELGKKYYNLNVNTPKKYIPHSKNVRFEETKKKMSDSAKKRDQTSYKNRMNVKNRITGKHSKINCSDYDSEIHECLVFRTDKKVTVIDDTGNSFGVTKEEYSKNKDKWKTHSSIFNKNKVNVIDQNGKGLKVSIDDPNIGILYHIDKSVGDRSRGTVPVFTKEGTCIRVNKNDPKIKTGEYILQCVTANLGKISIHNGKINKKIFPEDLHKYSGWQRGMLQINKMKTLKGL